MKCSCVWPLKYHLGLCVEKNLNKKANAVILCWSTASFRSQIKPGPWLLWYPFGGLINSKTSIPITFTLVSSPTGHNLSVCLAQVCALKLITAQYDRIACIELLLLPTSIQSGGWILHFLLCFRNIATHRGTSVGSDALNGPMSP